MMVGHGLSDEEAEVYSGGVEPRAILVTVKTAQNPARPRPAALCRERHEGRRLPLLEVAVGPQLPLRHRQDRHHEHPRANRTEDRDKAKVDGKAGGTAVGGTAGRRDRRGRGRAGRRRRGRLGRRRARPVRPSTTRRGRARIQDPLGVDPQGQGQVRLGQGQLRLPLRLGQLREPRLPGQILGRDQRQDLLRLHRPGPLGRARADGPRGLEPRAQRSLDAGARPSCRSSRRNSTSASGRSARAA